LRKRATTKGKGTQPRNNPQQLKEFEIKREKKYRGYVHQKKSNRKERGAGNRTNCRGVKKTVGKNPGERRF